jgi:hypothetical protein
MTPELHARIRENIAELWVNWIRSRLTRNNLTRTASFVFPRSLC